MPDAQRPTGRARQGAWRPAEGRTISRNASVTSRSSPTDRPDAAPRHGVRQPAAAGARCSGTARSGVGSAGRGLGRPGMAARRAARPAGRGAGSALGPAVAALRRQAEAGTGDAVRGYRLDVSGRPRCAQRAGQRLAPGGRRCPTWTNSDPTHGVEVRVFGSLAWAALTGLAYLTDRSDLDLLLHVSSGYGSPSTDRGSGRDRGCSADAAGWRTGPRAMAPR